MTHGQKNIKVSHKRSTLSPVTIIAKVVFDWPYLKVCYTEQFRCCKKFINLLISCNFDAVANVFGALSYYTYLISSRNKLPYSILKPWKNCFKIFM